MYFLPSALHSASPLALVHKHEVTFHFGWSTQPVIALIAGILILIMPRLLNFVVAAYLIIVGLIGIFGFPW
jgi:hypothetical protein